MARGFATMHPMMVKALQDCGIQDNQVTQSWGYAGPSAGFHAPEGWIDGHRFSSCVDLDWGIRSIPLKSHLVEAGFCPFFRDWDGNQHIHCVYVGAKDMNDRVAILPGPRSQIIDFTRGLDGLVGHRQLTGPYAPTIDEREQIRQQYAAWAPHFGTSILSPESKPIRCYAFYGEGTVRCEARLFLEFWGVSVKWDGKLLICHRQNGSPLDVSAARPRMEGGQFVRADVRGMAEALGLGIEFAWHGTWAEVKLKYVK